MDQSVLDDIVLKESRRCARLLRESSRLALSPRQFVEEAIGAKHDTLERFGAIRLHTGVVEAEATGAIDAQIRDITEAYINTLGRRMLMQSLMATENIAVCDITQHTIHVSYSASHEQQELVRKQNTKVIRKGQKLLPAIIKHYERVCESWRLSDPAYYAQRPDELPRYMEGVNRMAEAIGQLHASARRKIRRKTTLSFAPASFVRLARYGCDSGSCYATGGAHEAAKYILARHPTAFVMLMYDESVADAEPNAPRRAVKTLARLWGILHPSEPAAYINNLYQGNKGQWHDTQAVAFSALQQLLGVELELHHDPQQRPLDERLREYVYLNNTAAVAKPKALGINSFFGAVKPLLEPEEVHKLLAPPMRRQCDYCGNYIYARGNIYDKDGVAVTQVAETEAQGRCAGDDCRRRLCTRCRHPHVDAEGATHIYCAQHRMLQCHSCDMPFMATRGGQLICAGVPRQTCNTCITAHRKHCYCSIHRRCCCPQSGHVASAEPRYSCGQRLCVPPEQYDAAVAAYNAEVYELDRRQRERYNAMYFSGPAIDNSIASDVEPGVVESLPVEHVDDFEDYDDHFDDTYHPLLEEADDAEAP